jgi:hypothetical protein
MQMDIHRFFCNSICIIPTQRPQEKLYTFFAESCRSYLFIHVFTEYVEGKQFILYTDHTLLEKDAASSHKNDGIDH